MLDLIKTTFKEFGEDDAPRLAAALSYYTVFSLPPLLILITILAGLVWDAQQIQGRMVEQVGAVLGADGAEQIRAMIRNADRPGSGGPLMTVLSVAALIFGATGAFAQLQAAMNKVWDVEKDDEGGGIGGMIMKRVLSFGMILVIVALLILSLVLSALLGAAGSSLAGFLPGVLGQALLWALDIGLSLLVITALFGAMFRVLPDAEIAWRDVWRGALMTAGLFVVGKLLLGLYLGHSEPGSAFGAAGSLALLLVWIYYSAMIFFFGAELTQVRARRKGSGIRAAEG